MTTDANGGATRGRSATVWIQEVRTDDFVTFRAGRQGPRLVAEWPGLATLACARDGTGVSFTPARGAPRRTVGKLRRGHARALVRDLRGGLGLHASAVALEGCGIVFLGPSGAGKSTAAAEMCLRRGARLLADDTVSIELTPDGVWVLPSEEEHWLTSSSRAALGVSVRAARGAVDKRGVRAVAVGREAVPLVLVLGLRVDLSLRTPALRRPSGSEAARSILESVLRFDVDDADARRREFEQVTRVYQRAPFVELVRGTQGRVDVVPMVLDALERGPR